MFCTLTSEGRPFNFYICFHIFLRYYSKSTCYKQTCNIVALINFSCKTADKSFTLFIGGNGNLAFNPTHCVNAD